MLVENPCYKGLLQWLDSMRSGRNIAASFSYVKEKRKGEKTQ
jgi:hypothetical protein